MEYKLFNNLFPKKIIWYFSYQILPKKKKKIYSYVKFFFYKLMLIIFVHDFNGLGGSGWLKQLNTT